VDLFGRISRDAHRFGLNLIAAIPAHRYELAAAPAYRAEALYPGCRSIVVIGNGGGDFWRSFKAHAGANPGWLERDNPLDDFTREVIEKEVAVRMQTAGIGCVVAYPFGGGPTLNFMQLAKLAGLAGPSIIGVVVHPLFGPWIAFRAALLLEVELDYPGDAIGFDPCPTCANRSCISSCPAAAVSFSSGWSIPKCLRHRVEAYPQCADRCHARIACVLGPHQRYPDDELAYHQARALRAMRPYYEKRQAGRDV
jgi:epoxyqueuosine reductase QueG